MGLAFTKMHSLGNDYIYVEVDQATPSEADIACQAPALCDRHRGIGADGVVFIGPSESEIADIRIVNADGSAAELCGNATRCVGHLLAERSSGLRRFRIGTGAGPIPIEVKELRRESAIVSAAFAHADIGQEEVLEIDGRDYRYRFVDVGNPHVILIGYGLTDHEFRELGPKAATHERFPHGANISLVDLLGGSEIRVRVWERGAGATMACGSGAVASFATCRALDLVDAKADLQLPGGTLRMTEAQDGVMFQEGPTTIVFSGLAATKGLT